ncbi:unnamed protein product [Parajaminaea phylloscopi]
MDQSAQQPALGPADQSTPSMSMDLASSSSSLATPTLATADDDYAREADAQNAGHIQTGSAGSSSETSLALQPGVQAGAEDTATMAAPDAAAAPSVIAGVDVAASYPNTNMKRGGDENEAVSAVDGAGVDAKRARLSESKNPGDARILSLREEGNSEPNSPTSSRHSTPSLQSPNVALNADRGFGGAKRRGGADEHKALPRNIDRVSYGEYDIRTWYHSPYPIDDDHPPGGSSTNGNAAHGNRAVSSAASKMKVRIKSGSRSNKPGTVAADGHQSESRAGEATLEPPSSSANLPSPSAAQAPAPSASSALTTSAPPPPKIPHLWICEGCFKYMRSYGVWNAHKRECRHRHPPGRKVYQRGAHIIWEVDGAKEKLYAQNLSLFGKLFIDHKTIFFDVEPFLFYVVTDASANFDYVLGFFSKEKVSYDDYNLAVIITFPPFQRKGFGTLMIEFSYLLSARAAIVGTPERPLSELGFKGYVSYWSAAVLRTLALAFNDSESEISSKLLPQALPAGSPQKTGDANASTHGVGVSKEAGHVSKAQRKASIKARSILLGIVDPNRRDVSSEALFAEGLAKQLEDDEELTAEELADLRKVRRSALGFAGEVPRALAAKLASLSTSPNKQGAVSGDQGDSGEGTAKQSGTAGEGAGATPSRSTLDRAARHLTPVNNKASAKPITAPASALAAASPAASLEGLTTSDGFALATTLDLLSQAANLRVEDAAFALSECGLLSQRLKASPQDVRYWVGADGLSVGDDVGAADVKSPPVAGSNGNHATGSQDGPLILISRQSVRRALVERGIKRPVLDPQYVFL